MPRPIEAIVSISALRHNCMQMRKAAAGRTLWVVCKANGYGHGLENAVRGFADADGVVILDIEDAVRLRKLGWTRRILMIEGFFDREDLRIIADAGAETLVHSRWMVDMLRGGGFGELGVHVKVNSGMNRLGFRPSEVAAVRRELEAIPGVRYKGVVTHFANGERSYSGDGPATVARQLERMGDLVRTEPGVCMAATTGMVFHPEVGGDAVRAGIALYGVSPDSAVTSEELGIIPAQTLRAKIIAVQNLQPGEAVGYGSRWTAARPSRIGIVACGYADGYPRSMPSGSPVWAGGKRVPTAGTVSMDMMGIDITDAPQADIGSWVELWGRNLPVNEVAACAGTIGYELISSLMPRVPVRAE